jgi:hypothetical protein
MEVCPQVLTDQQKTIMGDDITATLNGSYVYFVTNWIQPFAYFYIAAILIDSFNIYSNIFLEYHAGIGGSSLETRGGGRLVLNYFRLVDSWWRGGKTVHVILAVMGDHLPLDVPIHAVIVIYFCGSNQQVTTY